MKNLIKILMIGLIGLSCVSFTSCGSKVDKKELDKKIEKAMESSSEDGIELSQEEYNFMVNYLLDNFDEISKMNYDDKEAESVMNYMFILAAADFEGKLKGDTKKKYEEYTEKLKDTPEYQQYKQNEETIMEALKSSDIEWNDIEESPTPEADIQAVGEAEDDDEI